MNDGGKMNMTDIQKVSLDILVEVVLLQFS